MKEKAEAPTVEKKIKHHLAPSRCADACQRYLCEEERSKVVKEEGCLLIRRLTNGGGIGGTSHH